MTCPYILWAGWKSLIATLAIGAYHYCTGKRNLHNIYCICMIVAVLFIVLQYWDEMFYNPYCFARLGRNMHIPYCILLYYCSLGINFGKILHSSFTAVWHVRCGHSWVHGAEFSNCGNIGKNIVCGPSFTAVWHVEYCHSYFHGTELGNIGKSISCG